MPHVLIEVRREWSHEEETGLIDAVHGALVEAFGIAPDNRHVRLLVHAPHRFAVPPSLVRPELYTSVHIDCFDGRTAQTKRLLYRRIVERLEELGIPADHTAITVREIPATNWGIRGGRAAGDLDLGRDTPRP